MNRLKISNELIVLGTSFGLAIMVLPGVVRVAKYLNLFDKQTDRKIHSTKTPPVGGIAIFIASVLSFLLNSGSFDIDTFKAVNAAAVILFFVGLQDDIVDISAKRKFAIQAISVGILILLGGFRITSFNGLFGFREVAFLPGFIITFLFVMGTVNAWNLIDGIDGQAAGLGILASMFFGIWFSAAGYPTLSILAFTLTGSLAGFFLYNVYGKVYKVFMGDSGSLFTGLVLSVLAIRFMNLSSGTVHPLQFDSPPAVAFAVLFIPLFDMVRVFSVRLLRGKTPFFGDRNHLHHRLLRYFPRHIQVTGLTTGWNLFLVFLIIVLDNSGVDIHVLFLVLILSGFVISTMNWTNVALWIKKIFVFPREIL